MLEILREQRRQKLRLRRVELALVGALFHTIACALLWYAGLFRAPLSIFITIFTVIWIIDLIFPILILTGLNKHFKDPSLTLVMVLWSQIAVMFGLYFIDEYRPIILSFSILGIVFGAYHLESKQAIFVAISSIILYLVVIFLLYMNHPTLLQPVPEWTVGISYAFIVFCTTIVISELSAMRRRLSNRTIELENSLFLLQTDATTDELTGLKNRRYILDILEDQRNITDRETGYHFSIALLDIDHFKKINDVYGHLMGDKVLQLFTKAVDQQLRKTDHFARIGGEEFLLVCPFTERSKCLALVERIRNALESTDLSSILPNTKLTVSIGVTDYRLGEKLENLLNRVDSALYKAKKLGRNQVVDL